MWPGSNLNGLQGPTLGLHFLGTEAKLNCAFSHPGDDWNTVIGVVFFFRYRLTLLETNSLHLNMDSVGIWWTFLLGRLYRPIFRGKLAVRFRYRLICWMWPPCSNSDHQDYYIFRFGNPNLNLHLPLLLGRGPHPTYITGKSEGLVVRIHTEPKNVSCHPCGDYYWGDNPTYRVCS